MPTVIINPTVHDFDTITEAYGASQTRDDIRDGDILIVDGNEQAAAVLVKAWPIAVTYHAGGFHLLNPLADVACLGEMEEKVITYTVHPDGDDPYQVTETYPAQEGTDYSDSFNQARAIAQTLGMLTV